MVQEGLRARLVSHVQCPGCGFLMEILDELIQEKTQVRCNNRECEHKDKIFYIQFPKVDLVENE